MRKCIMAVFISFLFLGWMSLFADNILPNEGFIYFSSFNDQNSVNGPDIRVLEHREDYMVIEVTLNGFEISKKTQNGQEYIRISVPDTIHLQEKGLPELPQFGRLLQIPFNSDFNYRILETETVEYKDVLVYPTQKMPSRSNPGFVYPFKINNDFYSKDRLWPRDIASLGDDGTFRDIRIARLGIYPFQYNPGKKSLIAHKRIVIGVDIFNSKDSFIFTDNYISSSFNDLYKSTVLNYGHYKDIPKIEAESMLVFISDPLYASAVPLLEWKNQRGIKVNKILMSEIQNTTTGIKSAIQHAYDTFSPKPAYVLLIGHSDTIVPNFRSTQFGNAASDYPYTLLEDDQYPDLLIGRILAHTSAQVDVQVAKIVNYEQNPYLGTSGSFYSKASGIASDEGSNPSDEDYINQTAGYLLGGTYTHHDYFFQGNGNATAANISAAINEGRTYINYIGHGSGTSWSNTNTTFNNSTVHNLANGFRLPIIIDVACLNGQFDRISECFGEAWMWAGTAQAPKGAVGYYGGSVSVSWHPPAVMMRGIAKRHFEAPVHSFGGSCLAGQMYLVSQMGWNSSTEDNFEWYNLFGDPSLLIRTANPQLLNVNHPAIIPSGSTSVQVTVETAKAPFEGALVCIYAQNNEDIYASAFTDSSGIAQLNFSSSIIPTDELFITVSGYNTNVYHSDIMAGSTSDGIVSFDKDIYSCSQTALIDLIDADLEGLGSYSVHINSTTDPSGIDVFLQETDIPGLFRGEITFGVDIVVSHLDTVTVTYFDEDIGDGTSQTKTDTALLDCIGPDITGINYINTTGNSIHLSFDTSKSATALVYYGTDPSNLNHSHEISTSLRTTHTGTISGLSPNTVYFFQIFATDSVGNTGQSEIISFQTPNMILIGDGNEELTHAPLYCYFHDNRTQVIYHSSEMGNNHYYIHSLSIYITSLPALTLNNWTIRLKHTDKDDYTVNTGFETDGWTIVHQGNLSIQSTGWLEFEFDTPFYYNGTQNLMLDMSFDNSSWQNPPGKAYWTTTSSSRSIYAYSDSNHGNPLEWSGTTSPVAHPTNHILNILLSISDTDAVAPPGAFTANAVSESQIQLDWEKNNDNDDILILWSDNDEFGTPNEGTEYGIGETVPGGGTVLYKGPALSFEHEGLLAFTLYYYRAFSYNSTFEYSFGKNAHARTMLSPDSVLPFIEDFDSSTELPDGWLIIDHLGNGQVWEIGTVSGGLSGTDGNYAFVDSDGYGSQGSQNTDLITPSLDLTNYTDIELSFTHYFRQWMSASSATLSYSTDGGENWTQIASWDSTIANPSYYSNPVPAVEGHSQVRFKWNYTGSWGYYWCIDDILITGTGTAPEEYTVSLFSEPSDVNVELMGAGNYTQGETVNISAFLSKAYEFLYWTGEHDHLLNDPNSDSTWFIMPAHDVMLTAVYQWVEPEYTVSLFSEPSDVNVELIGAGNYTQGETVNISAYLSKAYEFLYWTGEHDHLLNDPNSDSTWFTMPAHDVMLTAVYQWVEPEKVSAAISLEIPSVKGIWKWTYNPDRSNILSENAKDHKNTEHDKSSWSWNILVPDFSAKKIQVEDINGNGNLELIINTNSIGLICYSFTTGFFNLIDAGCIDFALARTQSGMPRQIVISRNTGLFLYDFAAGSMQRLFSVPADTLIATDFTRNGLDELIVSFSGFNVTHIYSFTTGTASILANAKPSHLTSGDLTGDGFDELVCAFDGAGTYLFRYLDNKGHTEKLSFQYTDMIDLVHDIPKNNIWVSNTKGLQIQRITYAVPLAGHQMTTGNVAFGDADELILSIGERTYYYSYSNGWTTLAFAPMKTIVAGRFTGQEKDDLIVCLTSGNSIFLRNTLTSAWQLLVHSGNSNAMAVIE